MTAYSDNTRMDDLRVLRQLAACKVPTASRDILFTNNAAKSRALGRLVRGGQVVRTEKSVYGTGSRRSFLYAVTTSGREYLSAVNRTRGVQS